MSRNWLWFMNTTEGFRFHHCNLCQLTNSCIKPIKVQVHLFLSFLLKQNFLLCSMFFGIFLGFCTFLHKIWITLQIWILSFGTLTLRDSHGQDCSNGISLGMDHFHFFSNDRFIMKTTTNKRKTKRSFLMEIVF